MATLQDDVLRVTALMEHVTSGVIANVYLVAAASVASSPLSDAQTLIDMGQYMDDIYNTIDLRFCNEVSFDVVNVFNVTQDRPLGNTPWPVLNAGASTADPLPSTVAAFIQGNTGYSKSWGRKFIGGLTENDNTPTGQLSSGLVTDLAAYAALWIAGYVSGAPDVYIPVIYSTIINDYRPLTEGIVRDVWATIRRRRIGRGA